TWQRGTGVGSWPRRRTPKAGEDLHPRPCKDEGRCQPYLRPNSADKVEVDAGSGGLAGGGGGSSFLACRYQPRLDEPDDALGLASALPSALALSFASEDLVSEDLASAPASGPAALIVGGDCISSDFMARRWPS